MRVNPSSLLAVLVGFTLNLALSGAAHAALEGRDLDGTANTAEAYYDTDRDITWLANANVNGAMTWLNAKTWAADLSIVDTARNIIYDNWRLPTVNFSGPVGMGIGIDVYDSLLGFNVDTSLSEMAHLFYDELGNTAYNGVFPVPGWGFEPLINLQPDGYWTDVEVFHNLDGYVNAEGVLVWEYRSSDVFAFDFGFGWQSVASTGSENRDLYALAVSSGDVGSVVVPGMPVGPDVPAIPEADTWAMLLAGLGLVGFIARRRKQLEA